LKGNSIIEKKFPEGFGCREIAGKICIFNDEWKDVMVRLAEDGIPKEAGNSIGIEYLRGRGCPAVVPSDRGKLVVRHYYHGGIFRWLTGDFFWGVSRFLNELKILAKAHRAGIPVPEPVGLILSSVGGGIYRGDLVTVYIKRSIDLLTYYRNLPVEASEQELREKRKIIDRLARRISDLHRSGLYHGDLQLKNLSIKKSEDGVEIFILDFDKASRGDPDDIDKSGNNLIRLYRSFSKMCLSNPHISIYDPIRFIRSYAPEDKDFRKSIIRKVLRRRWRARLRLFKWRITLRLRGSTYARAMP